MSSPPKVRTDCFVDALELAGAGTTIDRVFSAAELPRLAEAGVMAAAPIEAQLRFSKFDAHPVVTGQLNGRIQLTCQRCLAPVSIDLDEEFQILVTDEERADEPGGYEPVPADASRFDLCWLVEDQALLAIPLVPTHAPGACGRAEEDDVERVPSATDGTQKPFQNLRDMLRKR